VSAIARNRQLTQLTKYGSNRGRLNREITRADDITAEHRNSPLLHSSAFKETKLLKLSYPK
jgi:hypothetical protein